MKRKQIKFSIIITQSGNLRINKSKTCGVVLKKTWGRLMAWDWNLTRFLVVIVTTSWPKLNFNALACSWIVNKSTYFIGNRTSALTLRIKNKKNNKWCGCNFESFRIPILSEYFCKFEGLRLKSWTDVLKTGECNQGKYG